MTEENKKFDNVTNPKHYQGLNGLEAIEVHEDLKKARQHLDWLIGMEGTD